MELEDLKSIWKEQNSKLEKNISLNQQLLKSTFTHKAKGVIENLLRWEYFGLIEFMIFLILMVVSTLRFMDDWRFLVSGIFAITFAVICNLSAISSIKQLSNIDLFSQSLIEIKETILNYKKRANQALKIVLFIIHPIIITTLLLGVRIIPGINLFDYPVFFMILTIAVIVISYVAAIISHQTIYTRKFRIIENNLNELQQFKAETT